MLVICPGSFDPVHNGHLEIIARAASLFDEVVVGVAHNHSKKYLFSLQERVRLVTDSLKGWALRLSQPGCSWRSTRLNVAPAP